MLSRFLGRFRPDGFVLALVGAVAVATLLLCREQSAEIFHALGALAVSVAGLTPLPRQTGVGYQHT
jgi:hypothetical protein